MVTKIKLEITLIMNMLKVIGNVDNGMVQRGCSVKQLLIIK